MDTVARARSESPEQKWRGEGAPVESRLASNPRLHGTIEKFVCRLEEKLEAMQACWDARDFEELAKLAHWLKGSGWYGRLRCVRRAGCQSRAARQGTEGGRDRGLALGAPKPRRTDRRTEPRRGLRGALKDPVRRSKSPRRSTGIAHGPGDWAGRGTR